MPAGCFSPVWEGDKTWASVGSQDWTLAPSKEISSLLEAQTEDFHPGCSTSCSLYSLILSDASHKCFHCLFINSSAYKICPSEGSLKRHIINFNHGINIIWILFLFACHSFIRLRSKYLWNINYLWNTWFRLCEQRYWTLGWFVCKG